MIFIVVKFDVRPQYAETFMDHVADFTAATRAEEGNLWLEWSRSVDNPHEYVLVEGFKSDGAQAHVTSEHFKTFTQETPKLLNSTPKIISREIDGNEWDEMGEMSV